MTSKRNIHHFHIELTSTQYQLLTTQARQCGLTKRAFIVRLLEGNPGIAKTEDAKRGLCLLDQVYELMYQIARK